MLDLSSLDAKLEEPAKALRQLGRAEVDPDVDRWWSERPKRQEDQEGGPESLVRKG